MQPKLNDIIDALDMATAGATWYLDNSTGEIIAVTDEFAEIAAEDRLFEDAPDWQKEMAREAANVMEDLGDKFLPLPSEQDIHEMSIISGFISSLANQRIVEDLANSIRGKGAFRRFKLGVERWGIEDSWYAFKHNALKEIAIDWCEENQVAYLEEPGKS